MVLNLFGTSMVYLEEKIPRHFEDLSRMYKIQHIKIDFFFPPAFGFLLDLSCPH